MKDEKAWPSQVELSLDNRQIFLLFFASAVVLSLVFAFGVVVGKRMDARPARQGTTDPLALLDQMGSDDGDENLSYQQALSPGPAPSKPAAAAPAAAAPAAAPTAAAPAAAPTPPPASIVKPVAPPAAAPPKPQAPPPPAKPAVKATAVASAAPATSAGKDKGAKPAKAPVEGGGPAGDGTYTLQLSSFQEKREAEAFMEKLRQGGLKPYMTPTSIPGRGVWYRVRLGHFKSWDEALNAKQGFEKTQKIIAYVSKN